MVEKSSAILKVIHEAEKQAERIVRSANAEAESIREKGRAKAAEILEAKKKDLEKRFEEDWSRESGRLDLETREELDGRLVKVRKHGEKKIRKIDSIVDEMMQIVLPLNRGGPDDR